MEYSFIDIQGIQLAYIEQNRHAIPAVFFVHGNSGSSNTWRKQFSSALLADYRLIAFDLPGSGQSQVSNSAQWDYSPLHTGKIIAGAIRQLSGDAPYCLVGFSYGSNVVAEGLKSGLTPRAISLLAPCVIGNGIGLDKVFVSGDYIFFHDEVKEEEVKNFFLHTLRSKKEEDMLIHTADFFLARPPFRSALIQAVGEGKISDEITLLNDQDIPLQLIFGLEDELLQINYLDSLPVPAWENKIHKLANAGHYVHNDQPDILNHLLAAYLKERLEHI